MFKKQYLGNPITVYYFISIKAYVTSNVIYQESFKVKFNIQDVEHVKINGLIDKAVLDFLTDQCPTTTFKKINRNFTRTRKTKKVFATYNV